MYESIFAYHWVTRDHYKRGMVYVSTGNRVVTGADVESAARTKDGNFTDKIYVPLFEYWNTPAETRKAESEMSTTLWCDVDDSATNYPNQVGHPFSSRDKGRKNMTFTDYDDNGDAHVVQGDMCSYHADRNPFFRKTKPTTAELERMNTDWQAGYDAALSRVHSETDDH